MTQQVSNFLARTPDVSGSGGSKIIRTDFGRLRVPAASLITNKKLVWDARYGVTAGGFNNISAVIDQSGTGNNFTGHNGPNDFSWTSTAWDGALIPAFVEPAGQPGSGVCSPMTFSTGNTLTICAVAQMYSTPQLSHNNGRLVSYIASGQSADDTNVASFALYKDALNDTPMHFTRNSISNDLALNFTSKFVLIVTVSSGGIITFYFNGTKTVGGSTSSGNWTSGGTFGMMGKANGGNYWAGTSGQVIISTDCIDDATAAAYYDAAKYEWGVVIPATFDGTNSSQVTVTNIGRTATLTTGAIAHLGARSATTLTTGLYYFEMTCVQLGNSVPGLLGGASPFSDFNTSANSFIVNGSGAVWSDNNSTGVSIGTVAAGDVLGFAVNLTTRRGWVRRNNGSWNGSGTANPATNVGSTFLPGAGSLGPAAAFLYPQTVGDSWTLNCGQVAYANAAPSGFGIFGV